MGVNVNAWIPNKFDLEAVGVLPSVLNQMCPGPEVWIWDEGDSRKTKPWAWEVLPTRETIGDGLCSIHGPGLMIHVYPRVMTVWSLARWWGFLQYQDLRNRVRNATTKIMQALGTTEVIWLPDWALETISPEGEAVTIESLRSYLNTDWGPPQALNSIDDEVLRLAEQSSPQVWFDERLS